MRPAQLRRLSPTSTCSGCKNEAQSSPVPLRSEQAGRKDIQYVDFSEFALTPSYLAADCFHGSMAGSEAVAQYYKDKLAPLQCDDQEEQNDEVL